MAKTTLRAEASEKNRKKTTQVPDQDTTVTGAEKGASWLERDFEQAITGAEQNLMDTGMRSKGLRKNASERRNKGQHALQVPAWAPE